MKPEQHAAPVFAVKETPGSYLPGALYT